MDIIAQCTDKDIAKVIEPTVAAFAPLLKAKKAYIKEIPFKSFSYGPLDRHQLDIYYPPSSTNSPRSKHPILFFVYGGGLNTGDRRISPKTFGLVYSCVAAYFARRGYVVVIPDYRLVPDAVYPSPAEDVRDAVRWCLKEGNRHNLVNENNGNLSLVDFDTIVMLGHSAGALHIATMVFNPDIIPFSDPLRERIKALVLEAPPYDLSPMTADEGEWPTWEIHALYYGGAKTKAGLEKIKGRDPMHLYRHLADDVAQEKIPPILMVQAENEPDWLVQAGDEFYKEAFKKTGNTIGGSSLKVKPVQRIIAKGHNHISLNWALSTGQGEDWAEEVVGWLNIVLKEGETELRN